MLLFFHSILLILGYCFYLQTIFFIIILLVDNFWLLQSSLLGDPTDKNLDFVLKSCFLNLNVEIGFMVKYKNLFNNELI